MQATGFFTPPTLATSTGGTFGSIIAVVSAFVVAWVTVRTERRREQERQLQTEEVRDLQDRHAIAAALTRVMAALEAETRMAPLLAGRTQRVLLESIIEAHRIAYHHHPEVAAWLLRQFTELTELAPWSYRIMLGARFSKRYVSYAERLAVVLGHIQAWAVGVRDDDWFANDSA